eukprot:PITA_16628
MGVMKHLLTTLALILVTALQVVYGGIVCENLPQEVCALSVSSYGARCVLEKSISKDGTVLFECLSSDVIAEKINEWIETEECKNACGIERLAVGMSSDALREGQFTRKLCSPDCYYNCPNILDLYFNLAAGEGIYLPRLCEAQRSGDRRIISEVISESLSGIVTEEFAPAPAPSSSAPTPAPAPGSPSIPPPPPASPPCVG